MRIFISVVSLTLLASPGTAFASPGGQFDDSKNAACSELKVHMAREYLNSKQPDPPWYCDFTESHEFYYIVALRSGDPIAFEEGSNLVGWFAVAKRSDMILEFDVANMRLVPLAPFAPGITSPTGFPVTDDTETAACDVLKRRVAELKSALGKPESYWYCDFSRKSDEYLYIVALRSRASMSDRSQLVEWFAVAKRSEVVLGVNLAESRLIPLNDAIQKVRVLKAPH